MTRLLETVLKKLVNKESSALIHYRPTTGNKSDSGSVKQFRQMSLRLKGFRVILMKLIK